MKIEGGTVIFRTASPYFEKERDGLKCNTVRLFKSLEEENRFIENLISLYTVRIEHTATPEKDFFVRDISSVAIMPGVLPRVYIISWRHP